MKLNDYDLELVLQLYDRAKSHLADKNKSDWAEDFVFTIADYGIDMKSAGKEIGEHDEYLDEAVAQFLENSEEDEEWYADEDEWE